MQKKKQIEDSELTHKNRSHYAHTTIFSPCRYIDYDLSTKKQRNTQNQLKKRWKRENPKNPDESKSNVIKPTKRKNPKPNLSTRKNRKTERNAMWVFDLLKKNMEWILTVEERNGNNTTEVVGAVDVFC